MGRGSYVFSNHPKYSLAPWTPTTCTTDNVRAGIKKEQWSISRHTKIYPRTLCYCLVTFCDTITAGHVWRTKFTNVPTILFFFFLFFWKMKKKNRDKILGLGFQFESWSISEEILLSIEWKSWFKLLNKFIVLTTVCGVVRPVTWIACSDIILKCEYLIQNHLKMGEKVQKNLNIQLQLLFLMRILSTSPNFLGGKI